MHKLVAELQNEVLQKNLALKEQKSKAQKSQVEYFQFLLSCCMFRFEHMILRRKRRRCIFL